VPSTHAAGQAGTAAGEWPSYGGDSGNTSYAPLSLIDASNVERVSVAWRWTSPDDSIRVNGEPLDPGAFKGTPIMVDGVLFIRASLSIVAAVDAVTGETLWVFDPASYEAGRPTNLGFNTRGVA